MNLLQFAEGLNRFSNQKEEIELDTFVKVTEKVVGAALDPSVPVAVEARAIRRSRASTTLHLKVRVGEGGSEQIAGTEIFVGTALFDSEIGTYWSKDVTHELIHQVEVKPHGTGLVISPVFAREGIPTQEILIPGVKTTLPV